MNNGRKTPMSFVSQQNESISSFKPQNDSDNEFFYPTDTQEFSLINRCSKQEKPRMLPVNSSESLFKYKNYLHSDRNSLKTRPICPSCLKYEQILEDYQKEQQKVTEKFFTTEKHLKQYDSLLQIKDSRLQQQELSLKTEMDLLEKEKEEILKAKKKLKNKKKEFFSQKEELEGVNYKVLARVQELSKVEGDLKRLERDLDNKNKCILRLEEEKTVFDKKYQELLSINRELTIKQALKDSVVVVENSVDFELKLDKLRDKKDELKKFEQQLSDFERDLKLKQVEIEKKTEILIETENRIAAEQKVLDDTKERVNEEIESIDELKEILRVQEDNLDRERKLLQEKYDEKLAYVEDMKKKVMERGKKLDEEKELFGAEECRFEQLTQTLENLKKVVWNLESKLKDSEVDRKDLQDKSMELQIQIESLKKSEKTLKSKNTELEQLLLTLNNSTILSKIEDSVKKLKFLESENLSLATKSQEYQLLNSRLMNDLSILKSEKQRSEPQNFPETEEKSHDKLKKISLELEIKLAEVKTKEKEIIALQESLTEEKKAINVAAEYIKSINDDLSVKQTLLDEEKEVFEKQKVRLADAEIKQEERARVLASKEIELNEIQEKLNMKGRRFSGNV